jgi:hypothetical protein
VVFYASCTKYPKTSHPRPIVHLKLMLSDLTTVFEKMFHVSFVLCYFFLGIFAFLFGCTSIFFLCFILHLFDSLKAWIKDLFRGCIFHVGGQGFVYLFVYKIKPVRATDAPAGSFQCLLQYLNLRSCFVIDTLETGGLFLDHTWTHRPHRKSMYSPPPPPILRIL